MRSLVLAGVRRRQDLVRREDQVPEGRLFLDDAGVVLDVHRARHAVHQRGDVGGAAHFVQLAGASQLVLQRNEVDGAAPLGELHHLVEDAAVGVAEEVLGVDDLRREVERVVVQQDRAEHRPLRLEVVRKRAFLDRRVGHGYLFWLDPSATTLTFTLVTTSRWSFSGTA